jgi:hypothetical protein
MKLHKYSIEQLKFAIETSTSMRQVLIKVNVGLMVANYSVGSYDLNSRSGSPKGWRLELQSTGHRENIQIHRAHKSMAIEGCILPAHFNNFTESNISKGDSVIQTQSIALMQEIKTRYEQLSQSNNGNASLSIAAILPAVVTNSALARA